MRTRGLFVGLVLLLAGCVESADAVVGDRGLGHAEGVIGSCADACGDMGDAGNCWCDADCVENGDCCQDKVEMCGGEGLELAEPVLCREANDCPSGLMCDQSACYSGCREGEDCEDACLGLCVEPQQQSVPEPSAPPSIPHPNPEDDDSDEGAEEEDMPHGEDPFEFECNCSDDAFCVPLCPVCPPDVPEEDCQCTAVCVQM